MSTGYIPYGSQNRPFSSENNTKSVVPAIGLVVVSAIVLVALAIFYASNGSSATSGISLDSFLGSGFWCFGIGFVASIVGGILQISMAKR